MLKQQTYHNNIIHTLGWYRYDLFQKMSTIRKEQNILTQSEQSLVKSITQAIRQAIKKNNTAKNLYISKLQQKAQQISGLIDKCNAQLEKNQSFVADKELVQILKTIQSGLFAQLLKRDTDQRPKDELFQYTCAQEMLTNLQLVYKEIKDSYKNASPAHLQPVINAFTGRQDLQDQKDVWLRERPFFQMQEWKSKAIVRGLDKAVIINIPMAPVGFYAVRDGVSLYIIGGKENNFKICKNIIDFDLKKSEVINMIRMKIPRYYHSVAVLRKVTSRGYKSEIIIIGGENTECPYFDTKYEKIGAVIDAAFDAVTNDHHKSNKKNMSSIRKNLLGFAKRSSIKSENSSDTMKQSGFFDQIGGGSKRDGPILRSCEMFDPQTKQTSSIAVLNFARKNCGVCAFGSIAYAFCGYGVVATPKGLNNSNYQFISTIERFDRDLYDKDKPQTWWKVLNIVYKPLIDVAAVGVDDKIILIGGRDELQDDSTISVLNDPYISNKYKPITRQTSSCKMTPQVQDDYDQQSLLKSLIGNEDSQINQMNQVHDMGSKVEIRQSGFLDERMSFPNMASIDCQGNCVIGFNMYGQSFNLNLDDIK